MPKEPILVATFSMPMEAHLACTRLQAEGIVAYVIGGNTGSVFPGVTGIAQLFVPATDSERATDILEDCFAEQRGEVEALPESNPHLWVCSLCGDAMSEDEIECTACGTSRNALKEAQSQSRWEQRPARGPQRTEVKAEAPAALPEPDTEDSEFQSLETEIVLPTFATSQGDALAVRAIKLALVSFLLPPLCYWSFSKMLELMCYEGELSAAGKRNRAIALVLNILLTPLGAVLAWFIICK